MEAAIHEEPAVGNLPPRFPHPRGGCTTVCALALLAIGAVLFLGVALGDPLEHLDRPNATALRVTDRERLIGEALAGAPAWTRRLHALGSALASRPEESLGRLEEAHRFHRPSPQLLGALGVLYGEAGREAAVGEIEGQLETAAPELAGALAFAYLGAAEEPVGEPWNDEPGLAFRTVLGERVARRAGREDEARAMQATREEAGRALLRRTTSLGAARAGLIGLAVVAGLAWLLRGRPRHRLSDARIGHAWPPPLGTAVLVRGALWAVVVTMAIAALGAASGQPLTQTSLPALAAGLPFLALARSSLLAPRGLGFRAAFGLRLGAAGLGRAVVSAVVLLGIQQLGAACLVLGAARLGIGGHWSETVAEEFLWGTLPVGLLSAANLVLAVPWVEEIAFRGVLYATLRDRMRVPSAALLSATVYAAFHLLVAAVASYPVHTPLTMVVVLWNGLVWAAGYERTRSLLPCVLAHAGANLLLISSTWLVYR